MKLISKLNKVYNLGKLEMLVSDKNVVIERDYSLDTKGLNSSGLLVRFGIRINGSPYQVLYNSRAYASTITSDIIFYNERIREKHHQYLEHARVHFRKHITPLINN